MVQIFLPEKEIQKNASNGFSFFVILLNTVIYVNLIHIFKFIKLTIKIRVQFLTNFLWPYKSFPKQVFFILSISYPRLRACFICFRIYLVTFSPYIFLPYIKSKRSSPVKISIISSSVIFYYNFDWKKFSSSSFSFLFYFFFIYSSNSLSLTCFFICGSISSPSKFGGFLA